MYSIIITSVIVIGIVIIIITIKDLSILNSGKAIPIKCFVSHRPTDPIFFGKVKKKKKKKKKIQNHL